MSSQASEPMIAFTSSMLQFCPQQKLYSGCWDSSKRGVIQVTGGRRSLRDVTDHVVDRPDVRAPQLGSLRYRSTAAYADQM